MPWLLVEATDLMYYHHDSPEDGWHPEEDACYICDNSECICDALTDQFLEEELLLNDD